jgi:hypothetical protein
MRQDDSLEYLDGSAVKKVAAGVSNSVIKSIPLANDKLKSRQWERNLEPGNPLPTMSGIYRRLDVLPLRIAVVVWCAPTIDTKQRYLGPSLANASYLRISGYVYLMLYPNASYLVRRNTIQLER